MAPDPLTLRTATAADVETLAALYADCAQQLGPQVYSAEQVAAWRAFAADAPAFSAYVLGATTWLMSDATGVTGFCGVDVLGEVHSLYVRPDCARQGLGTRLLTHALGHARRQGQVRFTAWATPFSLPVFQRAGLQLVGTVREPFQGVMFDRYRVESA